MWNKRAINYSTQHLIILLLSCSVCLLAPDQEKCREKMATDHMKVAKEKEERSDLWMEFEGIWLL